MQLPLVLTSLAAIQFPAILGDLSHKTDVYLQRRAFTSNVTCLFANCEQAHYYLLYAPDLLPPGNYNNHSIGTFFEYQYYSNLTFRFDYLARLPFLSCVSCSASAPPLNVF